MVQSTNHLAATERDWRGDSYWLPGTLHDAYGIRALDGVSILQGQSNIKWTLPHPTINRCHVKMPKYHS